MWLPDSADRLTHYSKPLSVPGNKVFTLSGLKYGIYLAHRDLQDLHRDTQVLVAMHGYGRNTCGNEGTKVQTLGELDLNNTFNFVDV